MRITIWNEFIHERNNDTVAGIYPRRIHGALADALGGKMPNAQISTATLEEPAHGLTAQVLDHTDVLYWWGHLAPVSYTHLTLPTICSV